MPVLLVNRLVPRADTTAPTAPTITASAVDSASISVALTQPALDTESGVASYRLEYKASASGTWLLDSAALATGSFPRTITGLAASTAYDTRCRATDFAGNAGNFSSTSQATTQSAGSDWAARSTAAGVIWATNFATAAEVNNWRFTNQNGRGWDPTSIESLSTLVRWESSGGLNNAPFMRCESYTTGATPCLWWRNFDPALTSGSTTESYVILPKHPVHVQVRVRMNAARINNVGTNSTGLKIFEPVTAVGTLRNQGCHVGRTGARKYVQILNTASGGSFPWHNVDIGGSDFNQQPGSQYGECRYSEGDSGAGCYILPADQFVTYHLTYIMGTANTPDTLVRLEVAADGDTEYTLIYDRYDNYITSPFEDAGGLSALALWNRDESNTSLPAGCYHDFQEVILSLAPIACPNPTVAAPAWVASSLPVVGRWAAISLNTIDDVNPCPADNCAWSATNGQAAVIDTWQGGAIAPNLGTHGALLQCGAGHSGYFGNEVYKFDLSSRLWSRITEPAPYSVIGNENTNGVFPDGTPILPHTYDNVEYYPATKSLLVFRLEINAQGGQEISRIAMLRCDTGAWRYTSKSATQGGFAGFGFLDVNRNAMVSEGSQAGASTKLSVYRPSGMSSDFTSGTWTHLNPKVAETDTVVAYDPVRDIAVFASFDGSTLWGLDCSNLESAKVELVESGTGLNTSRCGWEYSPKRDAFIQHRLGTADVRQLKLTSGTWNTGTWTWTSLLNAGNTVTPQNASQGMYSRFRLISWGDTEVAFVCNSTTGSVYAMRLS